MNDKQDTTSKEDDAKVTADKLKESAETKAKSSNGDKETAADAVLKKGASEAKKAEEFDHGKNDAGKKD